MRFGTFLIAVLSGLVAVLAALLIVASIEGGDGGSDGGSRDTAPVVRAPAGRAPAPNAPVAKAPAREAPSPGAWGTDGPGAGNPAAGAPGAAGSGTAEPPALAPPTTATPAAPQAGSASSPPPPPAPGGSPAPSKAAFIERGDAICADIPNDFRTRFAKLEQERKAAGKPKPSVAEITVTAVIPPLHAATGKFEGLAPPSGDERQAEAIVAALERAVKRLEETRRIKFSRSGSPFADFQKLTREYGFKVCSTF